MTRKPLMRIWVTRDEGSDGALSSALRSAGLDPVLEPVLTRRIISDASDVISQLGPDDWLVLTSVCAIEAVAAGAARVPRVAVVGEASHRVAADLGFRVELVAADGTGTSLFDELRALAHTGKVCYPRSSLAGKPEPWAGVELLSPVLYETIPRPFDRDVIHRVDIVCVVSPSAVEAIGPVDLPYASLGPTTSAAIRKLGKEPWVESPRRKFELLAAAIVNRAAGLHE